MEAKNSTKHLSHHGQICFRETLSTMSHIIDYLMYIYRKYAAPERNNIQESFDLVTQCGIFIKNMQLWTETTLYDLLTW